MGEIEEFLPYVFVPRCRVVIFVPKVRLWLTANNCEESAKFQGWCVSAMLSPVPKDPSTFLLHSCDRGSFVQNMTILGRKNREGKGPMRMLNQPHPTASAYILLAEFSHRATHLQWRLENKVFSWARCSPQLNWVLLVWNVE